MNRSIRPHRSTAGISASNAVRLFFLLITALGLSACSETTPSGDAAAGATGSVSIFLTDAPSEDFDQILLTLERVELRGGGSPVEIFSGSEVVDLKKLENFSDLFLHADRLPARDYTKIRLEVSRVELVRDEGEPGEERFDADVPANGKIDLNPKGPFAVRPGVDLVIELDIDAKKSIHVHGTGSHRYKFRPVVMVTIRDTVAPRKLARVHGEITEIIDDMTFELCTTRFMATPEPLAARASYADGGLGDRHRCITVETDDATGIFDSNGDPLVGDLMKGELATVVGRFHIVDANHDDDDDLMPLGGDAPSAALAAHVFPHRAHAAKGGDGTDSDGKSDKDTDTATDTDAQTDSDSRSDSDSDSDGDRPDHPDVELVLLAYVIELGPPDAFLSLRGVVESEVVEDEFDFAIAPGQGFGDDSVVSALLQDGTRIFSRGGYEIDESEIIPETLGRIDGVFASSSADPSLLKTALIVLDIVPGSDDEVRGEIVEIDEDDMRLHVDDDGDDACVDADDDTIILILEESDDGASTSRGEFSDLMVGWRVEAYGDDDGGDCLPADAIVAYPEDVEPAECRSNDDCGDAEYCDTPDGVCDDAGVCTPKPMICTREYAPVCGCDDVTYANACEANAAGASIASEGECEPAPVVCGGIAGIECSDGEVCKYPDGECNIADGQGVCVPAPEGCPDVWAPVCGCDGETYGNACEALAAGAAVDYEGECKPVEVVCGGIAGFECGEGEVCRYPDGVCISDAMGVCIPKPEACVQVYDPVCSCDDVTYGNECEAIAAGAIIASSGECQLEP